MILFWSISLVCLLWAIQKPLLNKFGKCSRFPIGHEFQPRFKCKLSFLHLGVVFLATRLFLFSSKRGLSHLKIEPLSTTASLYLSVACLTGFVVLLKLASQLPKVAPWQPTLALIVIVLSICIATDFYKVEKGNIELLATYLEYSYISLYIGLLINVFISFRFYYSFKSIAYPLYGYLLSVAIIYVASLLCLYIQAYFLSVFFQTMLIALFAYLTLFCCLVSSAMVFNSYDNKTYRRDLQKKPKEIALS